MNEKRHFKMYKHGKLWVTALAGLGALAMGTVSIDAAETNTDNTPVVTQQVKSDSENETVETPIVDTNEDNKTTEVVETEIVEPTLAESEVEAPKAAEPKVEAPKAAEPKVETPKAAEPKVEAPKVAEPKVEAPKAAEPKATTKKVTTQKATAPKKTVTKKAAPKKAAPKKSTVTVKNGWEAGKYYKNGKALTGRQTINGKTYLFGSDGKAKKGLQTVGKNKQFYNNNFTQRKNAYLNLGKQGVYYFNGHGNAVTGVRKFKDTKGKVQIEAYNTKTYKQMRNAYYMIDKDTKKPTYYYFGKNGKAITGLRKYKDRNGTVKLEAYNHKTYKQMRNAYYAVDKKTKKPTNHYFNKYGKAVTGVRKFKDSKGKVQIEVYNKKNFKQMRNAYYMIDKDTKKPTYYYLGKNGKAIKGARYFGKNVEFYGKDFKRVSNTWKTFNNTRYHFGKNGRANQVLLNYKYYSQLQQGAPQGCEGASMQMALSHKGRKVPSLKSIYKKTGAGYNVSPYNGFYGHPFGNGGAVTETIFASALAKSFKHVGAADLTGAKKNDIIRELNRGNAIVTWADYSWRLTGAHSFHVMSIVGYNKGSFLIADPYAYGQRTLWVNQNTWEYVNSNTQTLGYAAPRSMNMVIR